MTWRAGSSSGSSEDAFLGIVAGDLSSRGQAKMDTEELSTRKRVSISQLKPGM
jgi:hypothetical protein